MTGINFTSVVVRMAAHYSYYRIEYHDLAYYMGDSIGSRICSMGFPGLVVHGVLACRIIFLLLPRPLFILIFALVMIE